MLLIRFFYIFFTPLVLLLNITMASHVYANDDLWQALKEGKKVIIMRHAPVNKGSKTGNPLLRDPTCKNEKNLSAQGKLNAEIVSHHFKKYQIPVSKVFHSPFCRTTDTAKIIFGESSSAKYLSLIEILSSEEATLQTEKLNQIIGSYVGEGNLVLVTHEPNIRAISFELLKHLDFLVVSPMSDGEFEELGVIRFSDLK